MTCHACGAQLSAGARFCHKCGASVGTTAAGGWRAGLPWALAGAALGALATVVVGRGAGPKTNDVMAGPVAIRAPDISQMSPEERADRLFNRIMIANEAGKQDSVLFFLPMALAAYSQLPTRDVDAHYHIGLMHLAARQPAGALAEADSILRTVPTHLFGFVLRAQAYEQLGNKSGERQAYADFLRNERAELARNRPEYAEHRDLADFRARAAQGAR